MYHQNGQQPTRNVFHTAVAEYSNMNTSSQGRSPQYNDSNDSAASIAQRRVAPLIPHQTQVLSDDDVGGDYAIISTDEAAVPGPPSVTTASEDTIVNQSRTSDMQRTACTSISPGSALTQDNISLHDRVLPIGIMSTYQWVWGRPFPGGLDAKDTSSKDSIRVRVGQSHASQTTDTAENEGYGVINHPSDAFITCAGDWAADIAAFPATLDENLPI
ncbi:hypothetical protein CCHL11_01701 [Colletotrichum chlorophyti]|uniref:Uncharacterized protein n=1 Tax=Colletotrichum chlorophyti TaxID=708187 RepID=A0A1Q8RVI5_9PEZI|nr:hypothetical protein CCHL11_01701 [Colletotrichum chlorophyti]